MLKFLIPTAKEMTLTGETCPHQIKEKSSAIVQEIAKLSTDDLEKAYKIKPDAAQTEHERWQALLNGAAPAFPAYELFNGLMYRQFKSDLSPDELNYLGKHVYVTSALYGVIPARQPISPHRLDFNMPFKIEGKSLKSYWRKDYDDSIKDGDLVISLLSCEFEEVFSPAVRKNFISLKFMEKKNGKLKTHSTISKKARGKFILTVAKKGADSLGSLKTLTFDGFAFQEDLSSDSQFVYVKEAL
ncbi:peroxide stress protein YaaA [Streptococcus henryi]|uniref:peroxide stress protein YaaA n=1 Tax=Streptococcus henryi TaxID=439219 RepID=UPI000372CCE8|nr:peroxide stress protein YaaA [Streptococcus henryi]